MEQKISPDDDDNRFNSFKLNRVFCLINITKPIDNDDDDDDDTSGLSQNRVPTNKKS